MPRTYIRKTVQKAYGSDDLKLAMEFVAKGSSIRESSRKFRVPYSTLHDHVNADVSHDRVGRPPKFSDDEEVCLKEAAVALQVEVLYSTTFFDPCFSV